MVTAENLLDQLASFLVFPGSAGPPPGRGTDGGSTAALATEGLEVKTV
jgi:hypothetical protein